MSSCGASATKDGNSEKKMGGGQVQVPGRLIKLKQERYSSCYSSSAGREQGYSAPME